jgi:hypothetical protein
MNVLKMKKNTLILLLILLFSISLFSQTKIDETIAIEMPGNVKKFDTIASNVSLTSYYSNNENDSYAVFRIAILSDGNELHNLPEDLKSLNKTYHQIMADQINSMSRKRFVFKDSLEIKIKNYIGYRLIYKDENSENQNAESIVLLLNGISYVITYSKVDSFNEKNKNKFLNSLRINKSKQIIDKPTFFDSFLSISKMIFYGILMIGLIILLRRKENRNVSKWWSINLKKVNCPVCQTEQPFVRIPKNINQFLWGGNTCNKCQTEMDKFGKIISPKN